MIKGEFMSFRDLAELYIEAGYAVTPVKNKGPFIDDWHKMNDDDILNKKYNRAFKSCDGLALVTGKKSGIICLDIDILDSDQRLADVRKEIQKLLPPTFSGRNGNRKKPTSIFYQYDGSIEKRTVFDNIDVEILSGGHACVLPESMHPNGYKYEYVGASLLDITPDELPLINPDLLEFLDAKNKEYQKEKVKDSKVKLVPEEGRCNHGSHKIISKLGVALIHKNYPFDRLVKRLLNKDKEINFNSKIKYFDCHTRRWKSNDTNKNANDFVESMFLNHGPDGKYIGKKDLEKAYPSKETGFYYVAGQDRDGEDIYKPDYDALAGYMIDRHSLKSDDSLVYLWSGKYYRSISFMHLKNIISPLIKRNVAPATINNFFNISLIKSFYEFDQLEHPKGMLNCNNGVLDISHDHIFPHNPDKFFKYSLSHNYNKDADCPTFLNSLSLVTDGDKDLQLLIQQVFGYCIIGGHPKAHKAFMFFGAGGNGKSTILTALSNLVGNENTARVPLTLFDKPFSMISLDGKLVNLIDETPKFNINPEAFKNVVSGGYVRAAHKGKPEVDLKINARIVFACNKLPNFKDDSDGMLRRLIIIPFNHRIPDSEADYDIDDKILAEMPGVLNFAIDGLKMLIDNGYQFHQATETDKAMDTYKQETDSVHYFFSKTTKFIDNSKSTIEYGEIYKAYKNFCKDEGLFPLAKRSFSRNATKYYNKVYKENGLVFCSNDRQLLGDIKGIKRLYFKQEYLPMLKNKDNDRNEHINWRF